MKTILFFAASAAVLSVGFAAPAQAATKEEYMAACMKASGDKTELCTCKTEQASQLVDADMMGYLVTAMSEPAKFTEMIKNKEVPQAVVDAWGPYVMKSNRACADAASAS